MSRNGSKKEFLFSFILKNYPHLLESALKREYFHKELEKYYLGQYIDMYGIDKNNSIQIYGENQLGESDRVHFDKVMKLLSFNQGIVFWVAESFNDYYLDELYLYLNFKVAKPINFYAITYDSTYISFLKKLNSMSEKEAWQLIETGNYLPKLSLYDSIEIIPTGFVGNGVVEENYDMVTPKGKNKYLLDKLREAFPYMHNLFRGKNIDGRELVIGAGKKDISYSFSLDDQQGRAYVKIKSNSSYSNELIKRVREAFRISEELQNIDFRYNESQIVHYVDTAQGLESKVAHLVRRFGDLVSVADPILKEKVEYIS
ncbi:hypothetical protein MUN88_05930 [Gracilibacillus caseinilyticus]|uniref:Uncharacterized protein n=1 Tax=Gracilibacillus caseinilyticus TaxID=2932256 RepID=A0ABY4EZB8_9BACI|nr:hypothetical protein [Gracilibacillus caseinilyticus]UOQ49618.1 hypothetical protein MUN88_05930 [Gracilibacillus caseinilyticus]